jgi:hypothetical protein
MTSGPNETVSSTFWKLKIAFGIIIIILGLAIRIIAIDHQSNEMYKIIGEIGTFLAASVAMTFLYELFLKKADHELIKQNVNGALDQKFTVKFEELKKECKYPENFTCINTSIHNINKILNEQEEQSKIIVKDFERINSLYELYKEIDHKTLFDFKEILIDNLECKIKEYLDYKTISQLTPEESFSLSIPIINKLGYSNENKDYIYAVSFLNIGNGEWKRGNPIWQEYLMALVEAAKRNVYIRRIFIIDEDKLRDEKTTLKALVNNDTVIQTHLPKDSGDDYQEGYYMNIKKFETLNRSIKDHFGEGFLIIDSNSSKEKVAIIDFFTQIPDLGYRTKILFNPIEIDPTIRAFIQIISDNQISEKITNDWANNLQ